MIYLRGLLHLQLSQEENMKKDFLLLFQNYAMQSNQTINSNLFKLVSQYSREGQYQKAVELNDILLPLQQILEAAPSTDSLLSSSLFQFSNFHALRFHLQLMQQAKDYQKCVSFLDELQKRNLSRPLFPSYQLYRLNQQQQPSSRNTLAVKEKGKLLRDVIDFESQKELRLVFLEFYLSCYRELLASSSLLADSNASRSFEEISSLELFQKLEFYQLIALEDDLLSKQELGQFYQEYKGYRRSNEFFQEALDELSEEYQETKKLIEKARAEEQSQENDEAEELQEEAPRRSIFGRKRSASSRSTGNGKGKGSESSRELVLLKQYELSMGALHKQIGLNLQAMVQGRLGSSTTFGDDEERIEWSALLNQSHEHMQEALSLGIYDKDIRVALSRYSHVAALLSPNQNNASSSDRLETTDTTDDVHLDEAAASDDSADPSPQEGSRRYSFGTLRYSSRNRWLIRHPTFLTLPLHIRPASSAARSREEDDDEDHGKKKSFEDSASESLYDRFAQDINERKAPHTFPQDHEQQEELLRRQREEEGDVASEGGVDEEEGEAEGRGIDWIENSKKLPQFELEEGIV